jgi:hypothetical protein
LLGGGIVESSKAFIKSGRVTPKLEQSTIDIRRMRGSGGTTPLYEKGALADSLNVKKDGIWGIYYAKYHYDGFTTGKKSMIPDKKVAKNGKGRNFIVMDAAKMKKPINNLMKQIGKALKK